MSWWQRLTEENVSARIARPPDRPALADLVSRAARRHGALAVEDQAAFLSSGVSVLAYTNRKASGFLGLRMRERLPGETKRWVDAAMVVLASGVATDKALPALLKAAMPALRAQGATGIVCLTGSGWLRDALAAAGFREGDRVITYARSNRLPVPQAPSVVRLRQAVPADAESVLALNAAAFDSLWRYDSATTLGWLLTADHAVIALSEEEAVGFALTSQGLGDGYDQLIRLAAHPSAQGRGIGRQLVADAIAFSRSLGSAGLALNTQASNNASRHLYEAMGFQITGPPVTVMLYELR